MKHIFWIVLLFPIVTFSQVEPASDLEKKIDAQAQLIKKYFNSKEIDSMYLLMAPSFQKLVSLQALKDGLTTKLAPYGAITEYTFEKNTKGISKYKTKLSAGLLLQTMVGIDSTGLINAFAIQPYKDDNIPKRNSVYNDNPMLTPLDSMVDKICRYYIMDTTTKGLSIGISIKGKNHFYNYGEADKAKDIIATSETEYEIGSVTKTFVAYLLAKAVSENKISLTDPITKYFPDSVAGNEDLQIIQVVHLANHSSGISRLPSDLFFIKGTNPMDPYAIYSNDNLLNSLKYFKPSRQTGEEYEYSNYGIGILGYILEQVYKMPFDKMVEKYITKPWKMPHTSSANIVFPNQAIGYNDKGAPTPYWNFQSLAPAGSIKSSAADMLKYGERISRFIQKGNAIGTLLTDITYNKQPNIVTLVWNRGAEKDKPVVLEHGGATYGFRSQLTICPEQDWVVTAMANFGFDPGASDVAARIAEYLKLENKK